MQSRLRGFGSRCFTALLFAPLLIVPVVPVAADTTGSSLSSYYSLLDFSGLNHILTATAIDLPPPVDSDAAYATVQQKLNAMQDQLKSQQPSSIALTDTDVNSLIAHNPALSDNNVHAFVTFAEDKGRLQASVPTDILTRGTVKGRFLNLDIAFSLGYDTAGRSINLTPIALAVGDEKLFGPGVKATSASSYNTSLMTWMINFGLRQNAQVAALLDQTQTVEIKNGLLVIQTK
jgi:hypothetical protein